MLNSYSYRKAAEGTARDNLALSAVGGPQYVLEVQLQIDAINRDHFIAKALSLRPAFQTAGLRLLASAWRTNADPIVMVNYWDIGSDANTLLNAELQLPDVPEFNELNRLIRAESKALAIPLADTESVPLPAGVRRDKSVQSMEAVLRHADDVGKELRYLRVNMDVRPEDMAEFVARVEGYLTRFTKQAEWFLGKTYYSITGPAGRISQLWIIPAKNATEVSRVLREAPWLKKPILKTEPTFDVFRATPSDPNLDPSADPV